MPITVEKGEKKKSKGLKALIRSRSKTESVISTKSGESSKASSTSIVKSSSLKEIKERHTESKVVSKSGGNVREMGNAEDNKSMLSAQQQVSVAHADSNLELRTARQISKQESRDSGIVLETNTKSKDSLTQDLLSRQDSQESSTKTSKKGSTKSKSGSSLKASKSRTTSSSSSDTSVNKTSSKIKSSKSAVERPSDFEAEPQRTSSFKQKDYKEMLLKDTGSVRSNERDIDPVYSLLKCAADLPKVGKATCMYCNGHHSISKPCSSNDTSGDYKSSSSPTSGELHEIVEQSMGSEFRQFYKLTSPTNKSSSPFNHVF